MKLYPDLHIIYWGGGVHRLWNDRTFDTWGIQFNVDGKFLFSTGSEEPEAYSGPAVFFTRPGLRFQYGSRENTRDHRFVTFRGERVRLYEEAGLLDCALNRRPVTVPEPEKLLDLFAELHAELAKDADSPAAANLLERLLFTIKEQHARAAARASECFRAMNALLSDIRSDPAAQWDFAREAREMGISYAHFRRLFHFHAGVPPWRFVKNCRFNAAMALLVDTDEPVARIAELCGFANIFLFSRQFKSRFGGAPLTFRKLCFRGKRRDF